MVSCGFLRKSLGFLRKSAVSCALQMLESQEKLCICENLWVSAKICVLGSLCHLSSVPWARTSHFQRQSGAKIIPGAAPFGPSPRLLRRRLDSSESFSWEQVSVWVFFSGVGKGGLMCRGTGGGQETPKMYFSRRTSQSRIFGYVWFCETLPGTDLRVIFRSFVGLFGSLSAPSCPDRRR